VYWEKVLVPNKWWMGFPLQVNLVVPSTKVPLDFLKLVSETQTHKEHEKEAQLMQVLFSCARRQ
jgi:hypothetical protein